MFQCTSVYMSTVSLTAVAVDRCMAVSTSPVPYNRCCLRFYKRISMMF